MMRRSIGEAGRMADALMGAMVDRGRKFRPHARETILVAFELGASVDTITEMVEAYMIPQGIEMPWGAWVKP